MVMSWSGAATKTAVFTQAVLNPLTKSAWTTSALTGYGSLSADSIKAAIFSDSVTPDKDAAAGSTGYNHGTWTTGNEVTGTNWAAGGQVLGSKTYTLSTGSVAFDAADVSVSAATISATLGCMVYDDTISDVTQGKAGLCFNYFGGSQSVTAGTFTIQWNAAGVFNFAT